METEVRFYYSSNSKDKIIKFLKKYKELIIKEDSMKKQINIIIRWKNIIIII